MPDPDAPCCDAHIEGRVGSCCDPDDCGPCCSTCPTCPTVGRVRPAIARSTDRHRPAKR